MKNISSAFLSRGTRDTVSVLYYTISCLKALRRMKISSRVSGLSLARFSPRIRRRALKSLSASTDVGGIVRRIPRVRLRREPRPPPALNKANSCFIFSLVLFFTVGASLCRVSEVENMDSQVTVACKEGFEDFFSEQDD